MILRQEAGIDRQIERKTRLLWEMQEVDRKRREDGQWQEIAQQEAEAAEAREAEARAKQVEHATRMEELAVRMVERFRKLQEQSRQVTENKEPASEEQGSEARETVGAPLVGAGQRPDEDSSNPVPEADQPAGDQESEVKDQGES